MSGTSGGGGCRGFLDRRRDIAAARRAAAAVYSPIPSPSNLTKSPTTAALLRQRAVSFAGTGGMLKRLPKDHTIWLLTQDETSGLIWPHGFEPVSNTTEAGVSGSVASVTFEGGEPKL